MLTMKKPPTLAPKEGKLTRLSARIRCPICDETWTLEWNEAIKSAKDIQGFVDGAWKETDSGALYVSLTTAQWGHHALCGDCYCRRVMVLTDGGGYGAKGIRCWNEALEAQMHGRLKHRQDKYKAKAYIVGPADDRPLADDQRSRRQTLMGKNMNNVRMSVDKARSFGPKIERWGWDGA